MAIEKLKPLQVFKAGEGLHADGGGLFLNIRGDSSTWLLRYTSPIGKRREMGLGAAQRSTIALAAESLSRARREAADARELLRKATDPIDARKALQAKQKAEQRAQKVASKIASLTLLRAARDYHERVIEPNRTAKHAAQWIASIEGPRPDERRPAWRQKLDELLQLTIGSITGPALLDAIAAMHAAVPETATRVRQRLEAVFDDCEFRGLCGGNPARAIRRKLREAKRSRQRGKFAALPYADAPAFLADLRRREGIAASALEFAMLTAARTGEVIGATWSEFDLSARTWTVPADRMKGGEAHTAYLAPRALEIVTGMKSLKQPFVFPSPSLNEAPLSNMAMLSLLRRMDADKRTTVHGICRATFSTWAYETAAARPDVIEACLAHREGDRVKAAYNRAQFNAERRALLEAWARYLEGAAANEEQSTQTKAA